MAEKEQAEKEPSIEEILESIRQIISDDGSGNETATEDAGAGKLDLSAKDSSSGALKDKGANNLDLSGQGAVDDIFKDAGAPSLDLSARENATPSARNESNLDLSRRENEVRSSSSDLDLSRQERAAAAVSSDLDLSRQERGTSAAASDLDLSQENDRGAVAQSDLDLSRRERASAPHSDLDLSQDERDVAEVSDLDLSQEREVAKTATMDFSQRRKAPDVVPPVDGEVFDLTNAMKVGVADSATAGKKMEKDSLLSEQSASAASAELAKLLSTNIAIESEDLSRIGKVTLQDMVLDLMRPLVKEWLDKNLPSVIERVVKREIEKLSQRAMDR